MKILWLAHEGSLSGANLCLLEYLQILKHKGVANYLIIPYGNGHLDFKARELSIPFEKIKYYSWAKSLHAPAATISSRFRRWFRNWIAEKKISSLIKKIQPDFVVTNTIVTPIAAMAAKNTGKKHIWFVHEFGEEDHGFTIAGGFTKGAAIMDRLSHKLVFNSGAVRKKYQPFVSDSKACIVNNAVVIPEVDTLVYMDGEIFKLILLGQLAPSKHHLEALRALKICRDEGLKFNLNIVGKAEDDEYLQQLTTYIKNEGLGEVIHFLEPTVDPISLLSQHHALLMCSHHEAFGRVTVEALKCGLPVIAANTGGSMEIIEKGINGYLYKAGDAGDLAEKILFLRKNYQLFNGREIAKQTREKYNVVNTARQLMKVFA